MRSLGVVTGVVFGIGLFLPASTSAQPCQHGASIFKTCESVKRTCSTNADCDDGVQCTDDVCDQNIGHTTNCVIALGHADTCGDTTRINEAFDIDDFGGDNVRTPPVGNLPIDMILGNAVCCAGPALPCFVGPAGSTFVVPNSASGCGNLPLPGAAVAGIVTFRSNTYVIQPDDPDPLPNQGNVRIQDLCNAGTVGCSTAVNTVQFGATTDLVSGCSNPDKPDSTPCTNDDGNACTTAGCDGFGSCDGAHIVQTCPPDSNPCTSDPACNPTNGLCEKPPVPDSTPCPEGDGNLCTTAGCEAGQCVQTHQTVTCTPDTNACTLDPGCNPTSGLCDHPPVADSTPCPDTDGDICSAAGCEAGMCVQQHLSSCIDHFSCYEIKPFAFTAVPGVSLVDTFGASTTAVSRPTKLCAPADKNDEDPPAPNAPDHLTGYRTRNPAIKELDQTVVNQFGTLRLDVVKTVLLFVPTAKSLGPTAPPAPVAPAIDHFQCYKVRKTRGTPRFQKITGVKVDDQFGTGIFDLLKPRHLCAPVNKNNEDPGAELHTQFLLCYKVKASAPFSTETASLGNQFGPHNGLSLVRRQEFCVRSALNPGSTTTTVTTTTVTTTTAQSPSGAFLE